jgi:hypothetical protein
VRRRGELGNTDRTAALRLLRLLLGVRVGSDPSSWSEMTLQSSLGGLLEVILLCIFPSASFLLSGACLISDLAYSRSRYIDSIAVATPSSYNRVSHEDIDDGCQMNVRL